MADNPDTTGGYYAAFRERLKTIRVEMDYSQEEMATALGIPLANYKKYEIRSKFPPHLFERLALVTQRPLAYIVTGKGPNVRVISRRATS